ncbi:MAG: AAA family ATPase [Gammaproteobacteria bacterium]|nr:AAA family ATPase [Gammaproteobacteria bacterium]
MNTTGIATIAPLQNVSLIYAALERAMNRPSHLPGMVTAYGPAGWGKTFGATYAANKKNAYYVELKSAWTRGAFLDAVLTEMGISEPGKQIHQKISQIAEQLALSGRPLIVDEIDHFVEKKAVEIIRDIYESSGAAILLIGEETVPTKLKQWERFHGRMLDWVSVQAPTIQDAKVLRNFYCKDVQVDDELVELIHEKSNSSVRRICVNLARVEEEAVGMGKKKMGLKEWADRDLFTGDAAPRRT